MVLNRTTLAEYFTVIGDDNDSKPEPNGYLLAVNAQISSIQSPAQPSGVWRLKKTSSWG